ncbi:uncharacterized protein LOC110615462 [Manihot esculenta]|uniref:Uncharacterized protein n=1 Tax=Manihot esculenta TaxID=3983 RepID=A0A2C9W0F2_MANES|nr:uncharacterized protein LOC110615462 [Manihot esculenta]OAY51343.1 hypothetical protein MANES_05G207100v8 [Manihot esculenta]
MNQSSSSSKPHNHESSTGCPETLPVQKKKKKKQQHRLRSRNPFQDLNFGAGIASSGNDNHCHDSCSNASSLSSIEAPKGCLRFFLSHASSSSKTPFTSTSQRPTKVKLLSSKTPKSAPSVRPAKENVSRRTIFRKPISQKLEKVTVDLPQSGRNPSSRYVSNSKLSSVLDGSASRENKLKSGSRELKQLVVDGVSDCHGSKSTPLNKVACGSGLNLAVEIKVRNEDGDNDRSNTKTNVNTNSTSCNSKTPPVQASVSPEIQCGSSMVPATTKTITPVCYGAGHVLSGITDKRKCRPRGILTVGEAKPFDCFDSEDESEQENAPEIVKSIPMLPLPAEASMRWLLSPCNEDEDQKEISEGGSCCIRRLKESAILKFPTSPLHGNNVFSPHLFSNCSDKSVYTISGGSKTRRASLLSPKGGLMGPPLFDNKADLCSEEGRKNFFELDEENSPLSVDSLGSGNVVRTPQSDSSSDRRVGMSWLNKDDVIVTHNFDCELNSVAQYLQMASLSPKSHVSIWDPTSSSFQFDCLATPSNSVDLLQFQKILDDRASWFSNSTMENVSQSQMRISWREGLVSRIFEMDEFDSCRCLSDEEDDAKGCNDDCLKSLWSPDLNFNAGNEKFSTNGSVSTMFVDSEHVIDGKAKEGRPPQVPCSCAESISTDGDGLVRSEDSDWTLCYKNRLFQ